MEFTPDNIQGMLPQFDELQFRVGWGTVEDHQHYHGYGGEYFTETWNKTTQAYSGSQLDGTQ